MFSVGFLLGVNLRSQVGNALPKAFVALCVATKPSPVQNPQFLHR